MMNMSITTDLIAEYIGCEHRTSWQYLPFTFMPGSTKNSAVTAIIDTTTDTNDLSVNAEQLRSRQFR